MYTPQKTSKCRLLNYSVNTLRGENLVTQKARAIEFFTLICLIYDEIDTERWYGKDLPFPPEWDDQIKILPSNVLPLGAGDSFAHMDSEVIES